MRITFDPDLPLDVHHYLAILGFDIPEAFDFPDIFAAGISEAQRRRWAFTCKEILMLPIDGAYRDIVVEMSRQLEMIARFRERGRVLTAPID